MDDLKAMIEYEITRIDDEYILQYLYSFLSEINKQIEAEYDKIDLIREQDFGAII